MIIVTLSCRECKHFSGGEDSTVTSFASEFTPVFQAIEETQQHMDRMFKARCQACFSCDWEVVAVTENPNGVQALSMLPGGPYH